MSQGELLRGGGGGGGVALLSVGKDLTSLPKASPFGNVIRDTFLPSDPKIFLKRQYVPILRSTRPKMRFLCQTLGKAPKYGFLRPIFSTICLP